MDTPDHTTLKRCSKCGEWKLRKDFAKRTSAKDGLQSQCKSCHMAYNAEHAAHKREYNQRYQATHAEELRAYNASRHERHKEYYELNAERIRERKRQYDAGRADIRREYRRANADWIAEHKHQYYMTNREAIAEGRRHYRAVNADRIAASKREYNQNNAERVAKRKLEYARSPQGKAVQRAGSQNRRARKVAAGGSFSAADIKAIRIAQGNRCYLCGKKLKKYHVDHFIPLAKGGTNDPGNLRLACPKCNLSKSDKHPFDIGRLL